MKGSKSLDLAGLHVLVVGLARSGVAAANFLRTQRCCVTATDSRSASELSDQLSKLEPQIELLLEEHPTAAFLAADLIVVSPGVSLDLEPLAEAAGAGVPVWGEVELAGRFLEGPIIAVTGSNGKTTTTTLIGELFNAAGVDHHVAGNIGRPLIDVVGRSPADSPVITELSSFQLETTDTFRPDIALLLNISPDHLDRHGSVEAYQAAKEKIFANQRPDDWAVLNLDDPACRRATESTKGRVFGFSRSRPLEEGCRVAGGRIVVGRGNVVHDVCGVDEITLPGSHNLENVLAAVAAGHLWGLSAHAMAKACRAFAGVEHRLERVAVVDGVVFFNDSKATNPDAARKALEAFEQPLVVILGGQAKGSDFRELRPAIDDRVRELILLGEASDLLASDLEGRAPIRRVDSLEDAVLRASVSARPGDVVLLAPACASFDMFENYEHRGREFKKYVNRLVRREEAGT